MEHRLGLTAAVVAATVSLLGAAAPALGATHSSVTVLDAHDDAHTATGKLGSAGLDIYRVSGAKAGTDLRLTMTVDQLPRSIVRADPAGAHLVMGVATSNAGNGVEPTGTGRVRVAGGPVCKGSATHYDFRADTVTMVLPLRCVGGGARDQVISGFTFRGDAGVDTTRFSARFSTR
jgi:hypothetical protein